jgi:UDP-2,3-diacylglucosamine hydrolase
MKFSIISDVHVKEPGDQAEQLLMSFLRNADVASSDGIFLIGDIFDLMIGPHSQYFKRFENFFNEIKTLLNNKKNIYYVEGNHDFHLSNMYASFFKVNHHLDSSLFKIANHFLVEDGGKKIHLSHGDDVEIDNLNYKIYKKIVTSRPMTFYANNLMPYFLIKSVGEASSSASRKKNNKRYSKDADLEPVKEKFRKSAEAFYEKNKFDIIVCGHSHVKDHYVSPSHFEYVNNGYAQHTKTYISILDGNISFKKL